MNLSDKEFLNGIAKGDREMIRNVYRAFYPSVEGIVFSLNGTKDDAHDIFQESLLIIYSKILNNNFELTCSLKTYLCAMAKNMRYETLRQEGKTIRIEHEDNLEINRMILEEVPNLFEEKSNLFEEESKYLLYEKHFNLLKIKCQKLLKYFILNLPLKNITHLMHFNSHAYTKLQRNKCKEYLMKSIFNDPKYKELTYEQHRPDRELPRW
jgi:DNA-directed RNA polymerase specialized sigma24 family protein